MLDGCAACLHLAQRCVHQRMQRQMVEPARSKGRFGSDHVVHIVSTLGTMMWPQALTSAFTMMSISPAKAGWSVAVCPALPPGRSEWPSRSCRRSHQAGVLHLAADRCAVFAISSVTSTTQAKPSSASISGSCACELPHRIVIADRQCLYTRLGASSFHGGGVRPSSDRAMFKARGSLIVGHSQIESKAHRWDRSQIESCLRLTGGRWGQNPQTARHRGASDCRMIQQVLDAVLRLRAWPGSC